MSSSTDDGTVVRVSRKGQATIPKELREKFDIETPGRVRFRETETGEMVVEPVPHPRDRRGVLASEDREQGEVWERLDEMRREERESERVTDVDPGETT